MKNKIIFLKPANYASFRLIPFGLVTLGSYLEKHGFEVKILDCSVKVEYDRLLNEIKDALLVGLTVATYEVPSAYEITKYIKAHSDVPVLWGGIHPTLYPEQTIANKYVDYIAVNEGEEAITELAKRLQNNQSVEDINGLGFKKDGKVKVNPIGPLINVEELPMPNYDLMNFKEFLSVSEFPSIVYESSRGCPYQCTFCWIVVVEGRRTYRPKSAKKIVDELEYLTKKYNVHNVGFSDDNFFVNKQRTLEFCKLVKERNLNITWMAECRADSFRDNYINEEVLDMLWESGLKHLTIGAESGSQRLLDEMKKGLKVESILKCVKTLSKYPIQVNLSFVMGMPSETKKEIYETIKFMKKIRKINKYAGPNANVLTPYPKSEIMDSLIKEGLVNEPKTLEEWILPENQKIYTMRYMDKPWMKHPKLIKGVSYSIRTSYAGMGIIEFKRILSKFQWYYFPDILFSLLARIRVATNFYYLLFDKFLFDGIVKLRNSVYKKYVLPHKNKLINEKSNSKLSVSAASD